MVLPLLAIGGAAALGAGAGFFSGKKAKRDPYGTLNPEQIGVTKSLGQYFDRSLNSDPSYTGELNSKIGQGELDNISEYSRLNAMRNNSLQSLLNVDPAQFNEEFNSQIADPSYDYFNRNVLPGIQENLPNFSTARGSVVGRELSNLNNNISLQRYSALNDRRNQALQASGALNQAGVTNAGIQAIPREIQQAGFDRDYQSFVQGNQDKANSINQMLNFLGISTVTQSSDNRFQNAVAGAGAVGSIAGAFQGGTLPTKGAA